MIASATLFAACAGSRPAVPSSVAKPPDAASSAASTAAAPDVGRADVVDLSVLRLRLRNVPAQAFRVVEPHWTRVPDYQRGALQAVLLEVFDEKKLAGPASEAMQAAAAAHPVQAAAALQWLRSPLSSELRFAEATASRVNAGRRDVFLEKFAQVSEDGGPEVRMSRIRALAEATGAVDATLDVTQAIGMAAASLVNASLPSPDRLTPSQLEQAVGRERNAPEVVKTYEPVVLAALLFRYRELPLAELDEYVAFARSDAGRWYHRALSDAVIAGVQSASKGIGEADLMGKSGANPVFDPEQRLLSLPSGRRVRVLGMTGIQVDSRPAVVLRYETFLTLKDAVAVRDEAGEVWDQIRRDVEHAGSGAAVLQATGSVDGWVFPSASTRSFAWRREHDGAWKPAVSAKAGGGMEALHRETLWSLAP